MRPLTARLVTAVTLSATAALTVPQPATAGAACFDRTAPTTYEESRIETPALPGGTRVPYELVSLGGFTAYPRKLSSALCRAPSIAAAHRILQRQGATLWRTAVARAQGRTTMGTIDRYDDRPLYWTRLMGTRDIRQWNPRFPLTQTTREALLKTYEYAARGITSTTFGPGVKKILISGFDPYQLNGEIRRSNPSGASALQLDGLTYRSQGHTIRIQSVVLPVTWSAFDAGIVEDAFGPHLTHDAPERADLIMTISQGNRGLMNIEQWAGAWRGGSPDNNNEGTPELIPPAPHWPQPTPTPEFIETTLPHQSMIDAATTPWPTALNPRTCTWPDNDRPTGPITCQTTAPTPTTQAQSGGGGNYLSNESMYRTNRLRLQLAATDIPGGHLHISALTYPTNPLTLIDTPFTQDRTSTITQTIALVKAAGTAA
ncbi:hypothetical protein [Winogradskya humida]|uniref:Pyrrolidone-carboxylate peptidase n=1 Tax=Winogradskya humida TaxID=113566 RepID=A0ABQ3ZK12_9ACTN|nr:hypothetical protein [Actinoplanes humidus]GIE18925.1 hypothetical protein Ahu01nite_020270 [Actinoplanes humidus]